MTLEQQERILIVKALIRTSGNITEAYKINVPCGFFMTYRTYQHKIKHVHKIDTKELKIKPNVAAKSN